MDRGAQYRPDALNLWKEKVESTLQLTSSEKDSNSSGNKTNNQQKLIHMKLKSFYTEKAIFIQVKRQPKEWEKKLSHLHMHLN